MWQAYTRAMAALELPVGVTCVRDTCNVYVLRSGTDAVLVDFGSGEVLDRLGELGIERVTDVLLTHHHRDQVQGLARAVAAGARVWAPPFEAHLIAGIDRHWQSRPLDVDYDLSEDRFSLLDAVPIAGTVDEYRTTRYGDFEIFTLPTPGHTLGSVTYIVAAGGRRLAFTGDLVFGDGRAWSLAATQWTYSGVEGQESTIVSATELAKLEPDVLLPSHGEPISAPQSALATLAGRVGELVALRITGEWGLPGRLETPLEAITPHLLRNRTTFASSYVLRSETGAALGLDFGYDMAAWRRPLLWSIEGEELDAVITTHYHDDHVAGLNLLRAVKGTRVWAPANVAPVLEEPHRYDVPCLWREPIAVDGVLPLGEPVHWNEFELTAYAFPGHTLYAAAVAVEVDGRRVLATGDQYALDGERGILNYQYRNRFRRRDFVQTAALVRDLRPELLVSGHWPPRTVDEAYLRQISDDAERLAALHDDLLPEDGFGEPGIGARIEPYRCEVAAGEEVELEVTARNPFAREATVVVALVLPRGWSAAPEADSARAPAHADATLRFVVRAGEQPARRARVGAELVVDGVRFGQQAEALLDVT
jgi:glyoxylase-like metal-dependent hydrolase (beta-lactamase superfamily II)